MALVVIAPSVPVRSTRFPVWKSPCDSHSSTLYSHVVLRMRRAWPSSRGPSNVPLIVPGTGGFLKAASPVAGTCLSRFDLPCRSGMARGALDSLAVAMGYRYGEDLLKARVRHTDR